VSAPSWKRALWRAAGAPLFRWSPHTLHALRTRMLRWFGADLQGRVKVRRSARIESPWALSARDLAIIGDHAQLLGPGPISLGERSVVSQHTILATEYLDPEDPEHAPVSGGITVSDDAWVATDALVLPGAVISEGSVVGARAVVPPNTKTEPWFVSAGHPVKALKERVMYGPQPEREGDAA
jgi:putative colanic acid biosynthesis acetyltransferase WcaF